MSEWRECRLGDIGTVVGGGTPSRERADYWDGPIPWLTPGELTGNRKKYVSKTQDGISTLGLAASGAKLLSVGSLLITSRASIGSCALAGKPMATNQGFTNLTPGSDVDPSFLFHLGLTLGREMTRRASGTTFLEISGREFGRIAIWLPPLEEQRRIAEILDTIDETIQATERVIAKLRCHLSGVRADLLEPRHDWQNGPADALLKAIDSGKSPDVGNRRPGPAEWGVLKVSAVYYDGFRPRETKAVPPALVRKADEVHHGDVLMTRANTTALVGMCCYVENPPPRLQLSDKTLRLVPNSRVQPMFLALLLQSPSVRSQIERDGTGSSGSMKNISQEEIHKLTVSWPPVHTQDKILWSLGTIVSRIRSDLEHLQKLHRTRAGLAADLLSGRVRTVAA